MLGRPTVHHEGDGVPARTLIRSRRGKRFHEGRTESTEESTRGLLLLTPFGGRRVKLEGRWRDDGSAAAGVGGAVGVAKVVAPDGDPSAPKENPNDGGPSSTARWALLMWAKLACAVGAGGFLLLMLLEAFYVGLWFRFMK